MVVADRARGQQGLALRQRRRALEGGRGRDAAGPAEIPPLGWKDILWRTYEQTMENRLLAVAAGVAFFGLLAIFLFAVFPFYWMVATSLKTQAEALASPPIWVFSPNLDNYYSVLFNRDVLSSLINSIIIAVSTTVLAVGLGTPAAYALARFEFKSKEELWFWFITNRMLSPIVVALPIFTTRWLSSLLKNESLVVPAPPPGSGNEW